MHHLLEGVLGGYNQVSGLFHLRLETVNQALIVFDLEGHVFDCASEIIQLCSRSFFMLHLICFQLCNLILKDVEDVFVFAFWVEDCIQKLFSVTGVLIKLDLLRLKTCLGFSGDLGDRLEHFIADQLDAWLYVKPIQLVDLVRHETVGRYFKHRLCRNRNLDWLGVMRNFFTFHLADLDVRLQSHWMQGAWVHVSVANQIGTAGRRRNQLLATWINSNWRGLLARTENDVRRCVNVWCFNSIPPVSFFSPNVVYWTLRNYFFIQAWWRFLFLQLCLVLLECLITFVFFLRCSRIVVIYFCNCMIWISCHIFVFFINKCFSY